MPKPACRGLMLLAGPGQEEVFASDAAAMGLEVIGAEEAAARVPALNPAAIAGVAAPAGEGEASCSFFPEERAEKVCDECGCFLSERAAISWAGRDLCLPCLHRLREVEKDPGHIGRTRLQDKRALALVTWLAPFSLFTAPLALYLLLRYRGRPEGFVPRSAVTWGVAFSLAIIWLIVWLVLIVVWLSLVLDGFS